MDYNYYLEKYEIKNPQILLKKTRKCLYKGLYQGKQAVIKIATDIEGLQKEFLALSYFKKKVPHLIPEIFLYEQNVLILEQVIPGTTIKNLYDIESLEPVNIICQALEQLHTPASPDDFLQFKTLETLCTPLQQGYDKISQEITNKAYDVAQELLQTTKQQAVLHGDLFHENILKSENGWVVIDPKGWIGDPTFDLIALLDNPLPELIQQKNCKEIIEKRIAYIVQEFGYDKDRIYKWFFVKNVLAWFWMIEDNASQDWIDCFALLAKMFMNDEC